jgi:EmrB/QacA subfamily drug resistance transporter
VEATRRVLHHRWWALVFICTALFVYAVDITIVNVALPAFALSLHATNSDLQWILDAYTLALAGVLLVAGGLGNRYGRKGAFMVGLVIFGLGSLAAALLVDSAGQLIFARVVMGVGAACLLPPSLSLMRVIFPPDELPRAVVINAASAAGGLALGPVIGGVLLHSFWWGSVFLVNVPITAVALLGVAIFLPTSRAPDTGPLDLVGAALSALGVSGLVFALIEAPQRGWDHPLVLVSLPVGVLACLGFVRWELRQVHPLFDVRVLARRPVAAGTTVIIVVYVTFVGILLLVSQYLQIVHGESALTTGLLLLPLGAGFGLASPFTPRLVRVVGLRRILVAACITMAAGLVVLANLSGGYSVILAGMLVYVAGWSAAMAPATTVIMSDIPAEQAGDAADVNQLFRQIAAVFGVAVVGSVFSSLYRDRLPAAIPGAARHSVSAAQHVAHQLKGPDATSVQHAVADAFNSAAGAGLLTAAAVAAIGAAVVFLALRSHTSAEVE